MALPVGLAQAAHLQVRGGPKKTGLDKADQPGDNCLLSYVSH